jgi:hypothetical protein
MKKLLLNPAFLGMLIVALIFVALHYTSFTHLNYTR